MHLSKSKFMAAVVACSSALAVLLAVGVSSAAAATFVPNQADVALKGDITVTAGTKSAKCSNYEVTTAKVGESFLYGPINQYSLVWGHCDSGSDLMLQMFWQLGGTSGAYKITSTASTGPAILSSPVGAYQPVPFTAPFVNPMTAGPNGQKAEPAKVVFNNTLIGTNGVRLTGNLYVTTSAGGSVSAL